MHNIVVMEIFIIETYAVMMIYNKMMNVHRMRNLQIFMTPIQMLYIQNLSLAIQIIKKGKYINICV